VSHCTTFLFTVSAVIMIDITGQLTVLLDNKKKTLEIKLIQGGKKNTHAPQY
jgi:hypothetical protein